MSTSDTKKRRLSYTAALVFCIVFAGIYEHFSHNVYSNYMTKAFLIPLLGGILAEVFHCLARLKRSRRRRQTGMDQALLAGGVLWLTLGSLFQGVLEIYGTTNHLVIVFAIAGGIQIAAACLSAFL